MGELKMVEMSLPALFERARKVYLLASDSSVDQDTIRKGCEALRQCEEMISKLGLFSTNETKEDISTANLKYIMVPYYLAELTEKVAQGDRIQILMVSQAKLKEFISFCEAMELVPEEELESARGGANSFADQRAKKIARFKRQKAAESKLLEIKERKERRGRSTKASALSSPIDFVDEDMVDDDGEEETPSQPAPRASSSMNGALKRDACLSSTDQIEPPTSRGEVSDKSSDQKTLKVRIKMGCDNSSTQKNAELYSGLGLDVSPSSSLGDSPLNSEGSYPDHHHVPDESPTSILQIMTSFPVLGSLLLSPLPDDVMCLTEKTKLYKGSHGSTDYVRGDKKVLAENKRKSFDKSSLSGETKKNQNGNDSRAKKEIGNDLLSCEELVSNALKLPLLSSSYSDADSAKAAKTEVDNFNGFSKVAEKISETKKENSLHPRKEGNHNVEKADKLSKSAQNDSKGRAPLDIELTDAPPMQKASHKATPFKEYGLEMAKENSSSSGGRKKSKEGQRHGAQGLEVLKNCSSKSRKGVHAKNHMSRGESKDSRKDHGKTKDRYSDIFGDLEFEHGDDDIISEEMPFEDRPNESEVVVKSKLDLNGSSKERLNGSKVDRPPALDAYQRAASNMAPLGENRAMTAEGHATVGPLVKEDWVCCDKCQKWRLLPFGMNPESLPEKWLCSMLNWLPGMNRCNFSEDETTNALVAHYRVSAPAPVHALAPAPAPAPASHMGEVSLGEQAVAPLFGHDNPSFALDSVPSSVKKKNGLKDLPNASNRDGLTHSSNLQAPLKTKGLNLVNQSSSGSEFEFPHFDKSSSFHKQKEKNTQLEKSSDGGDAKSSKMRNKRDTDRDSLRASKKMKAASMNSTGEDRISDHGGTVLKAGHSSSSGLSIKGSGKDRRKHSDHSKLAAKNNSQDSVRCSEEQIQMPTENGSLGMKRKVNEFQDNEISNMTPARPGSLRLQDDHRKEKRAKVSKSEGKESVLSKSNGAIIHPSLAATSSSSKISGSRKSKTKETKGSPVESVSSSPLRILNPDKFTSSTTNLGGKDDYQDDDSFAPSSSLRCSDGDHGRGSARSEKVKMDENSKVMHNGSLELVENSKFATHHTNGDVDTINRGSQQPSNECRDEERGNNSKQSHSNGSRPKKSGKASSSRTKDKIRSFVSEDEGKARDEKSHAERSKFQEENGVNSDKFDKKIASKKHSTGKLSSENAKQEHQSKLGGHVQKDNPLLNHDGERPSKGSFAEQADKVEVTERPKSHSLPPSGKGQSETGTRRQNGANSLSLDGSEDGIAFKKQIKKVENQNGGHPVSSRHPTPNKHKVRDTDAPSPLRKDGSSQAATNAVKEGKDLKHLADRLKNSESSLESTGIYFQAALKFLHGASLLESSNSENTKHGEMIQSMQMYSSTAKLCEFCAHEYEKSKDMASAALAYKCMEVAYMRVIYSTHTNASRDRNELQTALQIIPPGESPSSSASDIDNLNNPATTEKASLVKGVTSPQVVGNHVIAARNRSGFVRLLNFTQDVNFAMEASRKSRIALAAINPRLEETQEGSGSGGGISSVRTALDFNFQDVEGLLRLVRLAMEAISR